MTCCPSEAEEVEIGCADVKGKEAGRSQFVDVLPYFEPQLSGETHEGLEGQGARQLGHI